jgi:ABC-2 type transport system permease protein
MARPRAEGRPLTLLRLELLMLRYQKRTWVGLGGLAIVPIVGSIALYLSHSGEGGPQDALPLLAAYIRNGPLIPLYALVTIGVFLLPLATSMVGATTIAGEAEAGTIKSVLVRPVRRGSLLSAKWAISVAYLAVALTIVFVVGLLSGLIAFGVHPIVTPVISLSVAHTLWFTFIAYVLQLVSMTAVLSFAVMFSTFTDSSLTAAVGSLVIVLVVEILLQFSYFAFLRPYVFTTYFSSGADLFQQPIPWGTIVRGVLCSVVWSAGFGLVAWRQFGARDILV